MHKHVPALDGVRGAAVLAVLMHNFNTFYHGGARLSHAVSFVMDLGWVGVQLFFVLSGYLITGILLDSKQRPNYWRTFLGRRVLRIFPLYYAVLIAAFVITPLVWHPIEGSEHQIWLWTYLGNWAEPFGRGVPLFPHFWSLAIEEQFYLFWPLLVLVLSPRGLLRVCAVLALAALASRIALRAIDFSSDGPYMFTICRVDALAAGAAVAILVRDPRAPAVLDRHLPKIRWAALATIPVTILITRGAPRAGDLTQTYGYTLFALAFAAIVLDVARGGLLARAFDNRPLRECGKYSYAMYVFHTPLHLLVGLPLFGDYRPSKIALAYCAGMTVLTFVCAVISWHVLEKHFLALKRYFPAA